MRGRPGCRPSRAHATGLLPVGLQWAGGEAAYARGWCVALCATTAMAAAVPRSCVRGTRSRSGGSGLVLVLASPLGLLPTLASLAVIVAGCPARVSLPFTCWYAIPCGLCVLRARSGCPSGLRRVSVACLCACALAAYTPPPPRFGVAHTLRAVLVQGAGRAVPYSSCPSVFPAPVPLLRLFSYWRGGPVPSSLCLAWGRSISCGQAFLC